MLCNSFVYVAVLFAVPLGVQHCCMPGTFVNTYNILLSVMRN